jgi:hypothetical protein
MTVCGRTGFGRVGTDEAKDVLAAEYSESRVNLDDDTRWDVVGVDELSEIVSEGVQLKTAGNVDPETK